MRTVRLKKALDDEVVDSLAGTFLDDRHFDRLIQGEDCKVLKPDGSLLLVFRYNVLSPSVCKKAFPVLRKAAGKSFNRGLAAGEVRDLKGGRWLNDSSTRAKLLRKDGTVSNTHYANPVESGVVGYFDRYPRIPYCRQTAFNLKYPEKFAEALPMIRQIDRVFQDEVPDRYEAQKEVVERTSPDFIIHGTAFTTITVNKNWQTACHQDAGDLKEGFGVMTALRAGRYKGCYLVFPKYRVAVDMTTRCVLLADVHEWHGNTPLVGIEGNYERISLVCYYRENMVNCGSAEEELERAKTRQRGDPMN